MMLLPMLGNYKYEAGMISKAMAHGILSRSKLARDTHAQNIIIIIIM
jgi:hypothetical protein